MVDGRLNSRKWGKCEHRFRCDSDEKSSLRFELIYELSRNSYVCVLLLRTRRSTADDGGLGGISLPQTYPGNSSVASTRAENCRLATFPWRDATESARRAAVFIMVDKVLCRLDWTHFPATSDACGRGNAFVAPCGVGCFAKASRR